MAAVACIAAFVGGVDPSKAFCFQGKKAEKPVFHYYELSEPAVTAAQIAEKESAAVALGMEMVVQKQTTIPVLKKAVLKQATADGKAREHLVSTAGETLIIPPAAGGMPDLQRSYYRKEVFNNDGEDYMLEHLQGLPEPEELEEPDDDEDAIALSDKLFELARRPVTDKKMSLDKAVLLPVVPAYGVGATISSLIYPVLEALASDATLFAPAMHNWTSPTCKQRDLSCYFDSLPSLPDHTARLLETRRKQGKMHLKGATEMLSRVHAPTPEENAESLCAITMELGMGCPKLQNPSATATAQKSGGEASVRAQSKHALQPEGIEDEEPKLTPLERLTNSMKRPLSLSQLKDKYSSPLGIEKGVFNLTNGFSVYDEAQLISRLDKRWLKRGRFWLISQVIKFITTPNAKLKKRLDAEREQLGEMERPVLGLHVRKGDACGDRGECRSLKDYMPTVNQMIDKYGYRTVFLATPDPNVIEEVANFSEVTFRFLPVTNTTALMKAQHFRKIDDAIAAGVVDAGNEFEEAMISTYLLSEADGFIGGFSSNAARVAYSVMAAGPQGCLKPFDSFDINWCAAFGKGGPQVLRRGAESCHSAKAKNMSSLPCMIGC